MGDRTKRYTVLSGMTNKVTVSSRCENEFLTYSVAPTTPASLRLIGGPLNRIRLPSARANETKDAKDPMFPWFPHIR